MQRDVQALASNSYDLLVIGAGVYGLFAAWDAAMRGLRVALIDRGDFGNATSSNSLRVIHGGLRYLQHGDIRRMRISIRERATLMRIAPDLVNPLPFLIPTYGWAMKGKPALTAAVKIHDIVGTPSKSSNESSRASHVMHRRGEISSGLISVENGLACRPENGIGQHADAPTEHRRDTGGRRGGYGPCSGAQENRAQQAPRRA